MGLVNEKDDAVTYWAVWLAIRQTLCIKDRCTTLSSQAIRSSSHFSVLNFRVQFSAYLHLEDLRSPWGLINAHSRVATRLHSVTQWTFLSLAVRHANKLKFGAVQTLKMVKAGLLPGPYTFFGSGVFNFMTLCYGLANSKAFYFRLSPRRRVLRIGSTYYYFFRI